MPIVQNKIKPIWLSDEPAIIDLLHTLYQRLSNRPQRTRSPTVTLSADYFLTDERGDRSWFLLQQLSPQPLEIKPSNKRNLYEPRWAGCKVSCSLECLDTLRDWLGLAVDDPKAIWAQQVDEFLVDTKGLVEFDRLLLSSTPFMFFEKTSRQVLIRLFLMVEQAAPTDSLRELSARYFWGDSKFLDTRFDTLQKIFPTLAIAARKLQVDFYLPQVTRAVLFIENLDTYHRLVGSCHSSIENYALVYASGYRLSAVRTRDANAVSFHQSIESLQQPAEFIAWWYADSANAWPVYFWGDLDFSGMGILKALRNQFYTMQLWQPGYQAMINLLQSGAGHALHQGNKSGQVDPLQTGCAFADNLVLPLLRETLQCVDQEAIACSQLI